MPIVRERPASDKRAAIEAEGAERKRYIGKREEPKNKHKIRFFFFLRGDGAREPRDRLDLRAIASVALLFYPRAPVFIRLVYLCS